MSAISAPLTFLTTATRHAANIDLTLGTSGTRYNSQNAYRTEYSGTQRYAAGFGTVLGTVAPVAGGLYWANKTKQVGGWGALAKPKPLIIGAAVGVAAAVGVRETTKIVQDDGHLGSVGSIAGLAGGYMLGSKLASKASFKGVPIGALVGGGAAIAGAIAGYQAGKLVKVGEGHIGEAHANETVTHTDPIGKAGDFTRGAANSFIENGPMTQGVGLGSAWHEPEVYKNETGKTEQAGGLVGDIGAAALMGGGALAVAKTIMSSPLSKTESMMGDISLAKRALDGAQPLAAQAEMRVAGGGKAAVGTLAVGLGAAIGYNLYQDASNHGANPGAGVANVGLTAAAGVGLGLLLSAKVPALRGKGVETTATTLLLVSALSAVRTPVQDFISKAKTVNGTRPAAPLGVQIGALGAGGAAGAYGGYKLASKFAETQTGFKKGAILAGGALVGAVATGAAAYSFTPLVAGKSE